MIKNIAKFFIIIGLFVVYTEINCQPQGYIRNLGDEINTRLDEFLPYIYNDTLYFRRTISIAPFRYELMMVAVSNIPNSPVQSTLYPINSHASGQQAFAKSPNVNPIDPSVASLYDYKNSKLSYLASPVNLGDVINSEYNDMHPAVSPDGSYIIFASDRPGGIEHPKGLKTTDLYISFRKKGKWSTPKNLGKKINTSGNELAPFIDKDGTLYFSSSGYKRDSVTLYFSGLNKLTPAKKRDIFEISDSISYDIIKAEFLSKGKWNNTQVLPFPVNTEFDEIGYTKNDNQVIFASNRPELITSSDDEAIGGFDLYGYLFCKPYIIHGVVDVHGVNIPLSGIIEVRDKEGKLILNEETDDFGQYTLYIPYVPEIELYYQNNCLSESVFLRKYDLTCNFFSITEYKIKDYLKYTFPEFLFPKEDIPLFSKSYYELISDRSLRTLRQKFKSGAFGQTLETKYILNPDKAVTNYDDFTDDVEDEINDAAEFITENVIRLFDNLCLVPLGTKIEIEITGFGELNSLHSSSEYVEKKIRDKNVKDEYGQSFEVKKHQSLDKKLLGLIRAYKFKKALDKKIKLKGNYKKFIEWTVKGESNIPLSPSSSVRKHNGRIKVTIRF